MTSEHENNFMRRCKQHNYLFLKRGWPDFLIISPKGEIKFVEVKDTITDQLSKSQNYMLYYLVKCGFKVYISGDGEWLSSKKTLLLDEEWFKNVPLWNSQISQETFQSVIKRKKRMKFKNIANELANSNCDLIDNLLERGLLLKTNYIKTFLELSKKILRKIKTHHKNSELPYLKKNEIKELLTIQKKIDIFVEGGLE